MMKNEPVVQVLGIIHWVCTLALSDTSCLFVEKVLIHAGL